MPCLRRNHYSVAFEGIPVIALFITTCKGTLGPHTPMFYPFECVEKPKTLYPMFKNCDYLNAFYKFSVNLREFVNCCIMILAVVSGGAGGKGTWGKLVEVYDEGPAKDSNDPNYDSAEEV